MFTLWRLNPINTGHLALLSLLLLIGKISAEYTIVGGDQPPVTRTGADITLPCDVMGEYDPFQQTLEWTKSQLSEDPVIVTTNANVRSPFSEENRFSVVNSAAGGTMKFGLSLTGVTAVDSGTYHCQIEEGGDVMQSVTYELTVYDPVHELILFGHSNASITTRPNETLHVLEYEEGTPGYLECRSVGGYPFPTVKLLIEDNQVTGTDVYALLEEEPYLMGDTKGLQQIMQVKRRVAEAVNMDSSLDGKRFRCQSLISLPDTVETTETSSRLSVIGPPYLGDECNATQYARPGSSNVVISCQFSSYPMFDNVTWHAVTTDQTILGAPVNSDLVQHDSYRAAVQVVGDEQVARLVILTVDEVHYQDYEVTVVNSAGQNSKVISLYKVNTGGVIDGAERRSISTLLLLLIILTALSLQ